MKLSRSIEEDCAIEKALEVISRKWAPNIILEFITEDGTLSFSEIASRIPEISPRMLSMRLKFLIDYRVLNHIDNPEKPKKVRYDLTSAGKKLAIVLEKIREWGLEFGTINEKCKNNECRHGLAIKKLLKVIS